MNETVFDADLARRLNLPLDPKRVTTGTQGPLSGISYLEGHDVIRTANELFGFGNWGFELVGQPWCLEKGTQGSRTPPTPYEVWAAVGQVTVKGGESFTDLGTNVRQGTGSSGLEMAIKGAVTDAMKRALHYYGDQFGLVLYDKDTNVEREYAAEHWTLKELQTAMAGADLAMIDLAPVLGEAPTKDTFTGLIDKWLDSRPTQSINDLVHEARRIKPEVKNG